MPPELNGNWDDFDLGGFDDNDGFDGEPPLNDDLFNAFDAGESRRFHNGLVDHNRFLRVGLGFYEKLRGMR